MSVRRSKLEIILDVLAAVNEGLDKPTQIMYASKMSWVYNKRMLNSLVKQGLLRERRVSSNARSKKRYEITKKGKNTLRFFSGVEELIDIATMTKPA